MSFRNALRRAYGLPPLATKANRAVPAEYNLSSLHVGTVSPHFRDYRTYLQAYKVPWVNKCVTVIAENMANVKLELVKVVADGEESDPITSSPLLDLLAHPNPTQTRSDLFESLAIDLELTGNAFLSLEEVDGRGRPAELYRLRPDCVTVLPDPDKLVAGYRFGVNGRTVNYGVNEMIHCRWPNPLDELYGMGRIEAAEARIDSEQAMAEHERQFWRNGAKITGVLSTDEELDETVFKRVSQQVRGFFRGSGYSTLMLESGLTYTPVSDGPAKLGMIEMANQSRDTILALFGVPPTKVGILDNANYKAQSADEFFWSELIDPKLTRLENQLQPLVEVFHPGQGLRLKFARLNFVDDLPAATVAEKMANQRAFTINEIRKYQGAEPLPDGGDVILAPTGFLPIDLANDMPTVNELRALSGDPPLPGGDDLILIRGRATPVNLAAPPPPPPPMGGALPATVPPVLPPDPNAIPPQGAANGATA